MGLASGTLIIRGVGHLREWNILVRILIMGLWERENSFEKL